jgi:mRNA interferase MazF
VIARGDIRWFRFASPDKRRPVLVLGKPDVLPSLSQVPVIPLSTQVRALAWEVALTEADGVPTPCVVKPEWIRIVDRSSLGPLVATLPEARWSEIRAALLDVLGFEP